MKQESRTNINRVKKDISSPDSFTPPEELKRQLITTMQSIYDEEDIEAVERAYKVAYKAHEKQKRKSGEPYIIHPLCVAIILADLELEDFNSADKLFEQIANVERPKEFGCEFGRGFDLIRWGFFYDNSRLQQLKEHGTVRRSTEGVKNPVNYSDIANDPELKSSFDTYLPGHEFLPIVQQLMNNNPNLKGNSANYSTDNSSYFRDNGWTVRSVVDLSK